MKRFLVFAILIAVSGCSTNTLSKRLLIGKWKAVTLNGSHLVNEGFDWVTLSITEGNLEVQAHLHSQANLTAISRGTWKLVGHTLRIDYGAGGIKDVQVYYENGELVFTPDLLLKDKVISRYETAPRDSAQ
jgi:hypothetical protein